MLIHKSKYLFSILLLALLAAILTVSCYFYRQSQFVANLDSRAMAAGLVGKINNHNMDPALIGNHEEKLIASALYEGLVYYDETESAIKPLLATKWQYSGDGKSLTLTLKKQVRCSNGKFLTAALIKNAWERNLLLAQDWAELSLMLEIEGALNKLKGENSDITGIEAINNYTLRLKFENPNSAFISMLTHPIFWVYDSEDQTEIKSGTGPFILNEKTESEWILIRNDKYHKTLPHLSAIDFIIYADANEAWSDFQIGKIDYLDQVPLNEIKNIKNNKEYQPYIIENPLFDTYSFAFNLKQEPWSDNYLLRRAINYAIDRQAIIEQVLGESYTPINSILPPQITGYNPQMRGYNYNLEQAKKLLAQAGFPEGKGLMPINLFYNEDDGHFMVAQAIANQLSDLGIILQLQHMDWDYYKKQIQSLKLTTFRLGWQADYPDGDNFLYSLFHSSRIGTSNYCGYYNPQVDKLLDAARAETKEKSQRNSLLQRAEEIIVDDAPMLWLFQKQAFKLTSPQVTHMEIDGLEMINWNKIVLLKPSSPLSLDPEKNEENASEEIK